MHRNAIALIALAGLSCGAVAQDSVSKHMGLPGDALDQYAAADVRRDYVVDMVPLFTSWGTEFGIAPVIKLTRSLNPNFFNVFASSNAISNSLLPSSQVAADSYALWTTPGQGVSMPNNNAAAGSVDFSCGDRALQFAVASNEFESAYNGIIGAVVNYRPNDPTRLYVSRVQAAINGASSTEDSAGLGFGAIDGYGNLHLRATSVGAPGPSPIAFENYLRIRLPDRSAATNIIKDIGGTDAAATDWVLKNDATTHSVPSIIPQNVAGRPVMVGLNFDREYAYEMNAGATSWTTTHRGSPEFTPDQRGNIAFSSAVHYPGSVGTCASYCKNTVVPPTPFSDTDGFLLWGVDAGGNVVDADRIALPAAITDNDDGFDTATHGGGGGILGFTNHFGTTAFFGGNGQVAVGKDQQGNTLVAGTVALFDPFYNASLATNGANAVAVAKITPAGAVSWTLAGYNNFNVGSGKAIRDGRNGASIGILTEFIALNPSITGPSISSPAMDSVGNVYFLAVAELFDPMGGPSDFDVVLLRAVLDPATFSYQLELVLEVGWVFPGANSGTDYQIRFIQLANNAGGAASNGYWSGLVNQSAAHGISPAAIADTADPRTLGGLVLAANIVYDANQDGDFDDVDADPLTNIPSDELQKVLLYIGCTETAPFCPGDMEGDGDVDVFDFLAFQNLFAQQDPRADVECDSDWDVFDYLAFLNLTSQGCS